MSDAYVEENLCLIEEEAVLSYRKLKMHKHKSISNKVIYHFQRHLHLAQ